ncbi:MAG: formylglycine-generating enzyme family protein [Proteobacteria bacterium]|nr:formylglycine-generating enzyme family protein [Pseudomonadota bacterium]
MTAPAPVRKKMAASPGVADAPAASAPQPSAGAPPPLLPPPPAPRWRDHVRPVLYPLPGGELALRRTWLRRGFWFGLALLFGAGVVAPFVVPDAVRRWTQPAPAAAPAVERAGDYPPGTRLRDCSDGTCPWLVVVPSGRFAMGSPAGEAGRSEDEGPQHEVAIAYRFAVMEAEVTRGEFAAFVQQTKHDTSGGCYIWAGDKYVQVPGADWRNPGFKQTDQHPVVCVSWNDAQAYARWMSTRTGQQYRLPSEAEWEYVARAGSTTRFFFGDRDDDLCAHANVGDRTTRDGLKGWQKDWIAADCADGQVYTAPVKSYKPNGFGLYDVAGNAWEWTQDCWHDNYAGAPRDGKAWETECKDVRRVLRGGGWVSIPVLARSAGRSRNSPDYRVGGSGFRLARTLTP